MNGLGMDFPAVSYFAGGFLNNFLSYKSCLENYDFINITEKNK